MIDEPVPTMPEMVPARSPTARTKRKFKDRPSIGFRLATGRACFAGKGQDCNHSSCDYMNPGLRGKYPVQSPKPRVDINNIGNVMRIPCSIAVLRAVSLVPGRNAETCVAPLSAARVSAVLNAA